MNRTTLRERAAGWLREHLNGFHKNEGGAIAIMCLAACLILFMIGLVVYDTGKATREKIQVQTASDIAAYSQASIKARTMNMVAYTNVAKRSILAAQGVYHAALIDYVAWVGGQAAKCAKCLFVCWLPYMPCPNAAGAVPILAGEAIDVIKLVVSGLKKYNTELEAITRYQAYMTTLTPYWAYMEAAYSASRNGATLSGSFPPPPNLVLTTAGNILQQITNALKMAPLYPQTMHPGDYLPTAPAKLSGFGGLILNIAASDPQAVLACFDAGYISGVAQDPLFLAELEWNISQQNSKSAPGILFTGPKRSAGAYRNPVTGTLGCMAGTDPLGLQNTAGRIPGLSAILKSIVQGIEGKNAVAFKYDPTAYGCMKASPGFTFAKVGLLPKRDSNRCEVSGSSTVKESSANWTKTNSNLAMTYLYSEMSTKGRDKYKYLKQDYTRTQGVFESPSGLWSMARGEFIYVGPLILGGLISDNPSPWHTAWTARLRPVALNKDEWKNYKGSYSINAAFHDALPYMGIQGIAALISGKDTGIIISDFMFFEKASRAMDNGSHNGLFR